jgi:hypothetical protein
VIQFNEEQFLLKISNLQATKAVNLWREIGTIRWNRPNFFKANSIVPRGTIQNTILDIYLKVLSYGLYPNNSKFKTRHSKLKKY